MSVGKPCRNHAVLCYLMMGLISPAILFTFTLLFGEGSYQYWGERYHLNLTNKYLFGRAAGESLVGPLWREDTLSGNLWLGDLPVSPLALTNLAARFFQLSPFGNEAFEILLLYVVATTSMYLYLRRVLSLSREAASVAAVVFGSTAYWLTSGEGNVEMAMGPAWFPGLLVVAHALHESGGVRAGLATVGLSLAFYGYALNSSPSTLVSVCVLLTLYGGLVFRSVRSLSLVLVAIGVGVTLYAPFLWTLAQAMKLSSRYLPDFWSPPPFDFLRLLAHGKAMLGRVAVGHNQYGLYMVVVLVAALWLVSAERWEREPRRLRLAVGFAAWLAPCLVLLEFVNEEVNRLKSQLPFLSGWNVERSALFTFVPITIVFAWMLDRTLFAPSSSQPARGRLLGARVVLAIVGGLAGLQIGHSVSRMEQVPTTIAPQNVTLYFYGMLYVCAVAALLTLLYRATCLPEGVPSMRPAHGWLVVLMGLAVSLTTAVHAYRSGVLPARGGPNQTIMTYAQRYAVPDELAEVKRLNERGGRVVDLTREMPDDPWTAETENAELPLSGLRTPSGYSLLFPNSYGRMVAIGINGDAGGPFKSVVQVRATSATNFDALGLIDVQYVLAYEGTRIPGYREVRRFERLGKVLWAPEQEVGPAFLSSGVACFASDTDALSHLHRNSLHQLRERAVLVSDDQGAAHLCAMGRTLPVSESGDGRVLHVQRGIDRVRIEVENSPGGVLTLADSYYPGWTVYVNGSERPLLRTYTALRGVEIGVGRQSVEFRFEPKLFWTLFRASGLLLVFLCVLSLAAWVWHRGRVAGVELVRGASQSKW